MSNLDSILSTSEGRVRPVLQIPSTIVKVCFEGARMEIDCAQHRSKMVGHLAMKSTKSENRCSREAENATVMAQEA